MSTNTQREAWLSGPVSGIPGLLQPVAHALLQVKSEVHALMTDFPETLIWERPAGLASPAFHLQHLTGVLDRLFTYARGESLNTEQFNYLSTEGRRIDNHEIMIPQLLASFDLQVERSLDQLRQTDEKTLLTARSVGRARLPSNTLGLLFHAAEHSQRHTGQLLVTVRILHPSKQTGI